MVEIEDDEMGDVLPPAHLQESGDYGHASFSLLGAFRVRSFQTFTFLYTFGAFVLDDTGTIKIVNRWVGDGVSLQCDDPSAPS